MQVLQDYFFYDCPSFAVLAGDFGSRLSAGFAQKTAQDVEDRRKQLDQKRKQILRENILNLLHLDDNLLLNAAPKSEQEQDIDNQQKQVAVTEK